MRYGVQMYGLNPIFLKDKETFLRRIRTAGYRYLEPCLMLHAIPGLEDRGWMPADFEANRPLLEQYGFHTHSCHVFTQDLPADLPQLIQVAKTYGICQFVLPCPQTPSEETARAIAQAADILRSAGIELLLHNDRKDSSARIDGVSVYEWYLTHCGDGVYAQPDVGWLLFGGVDPEQFLWRYQGKVRSLHYKDMKATPEGLAETGIGHGLVDMTACFQFARAAEIIQIADQDGSEGDFLEDMEHVAEQFRSLAQYRGNTRSILCVMDIDTLEVTRLKTFDRIIEAPNWMHTDPDSLIYNADGRIFRYRISSGTETQIDTGHCTNCNNDHVMSPDEGEIAVSHSETGWLSQIYILPISGGAPRLVTPKGPSYLHGWSPDGRELAYCAFRDQGKGMEVDIWAISRDGGEEWQLTRDAGFNDGPEYAPNGKHIWFISTRSGLMQCWRMNRDGSEQTQMTFRSRNNWFPHVSPDGEHVLYLSYSRDGLDPNEHLPNMHVELGLMDADGSNDRCILRFFGGQGSINVNSWHPDSRKFAFVMYELDHA